MNLLQSVIVTRGEDYYVYSLRSQSYHQFNELGLKELLELLKSNSQSELSKSEHLYLYNELKDDLQDGKFDGIKIFDDGALESVTVEVCQSCNISCRHCYLSKKKVGVVMPTALFFNIVDEIVELGAFRIGITGGEPLTDPDIYKKIEYGRKRKLIVTLNTNGILIDEIACVRLKKADVSSVGLTISDNPSYFDYLYGEGNYQKVLTSIALLNKHNIKVYIKCLAWGKHQEIIDFEERLKREFKIHYFSYSRVQLKGNAKNRRNILSPNANKDDGCKKIYGKSLSCMAGRRSLYILSDGGVKACVDFDFINGNVNKSSLKSLYYKMSCREK